MDTQAWRPLAAEERAKLDGQRSRGLARLGSSGEAPAPAPASAAEMVRAADELVDREQVQRQRLIRGLFLLFFRSPESLIEELGAVFGEQLVGAFGWQWGYAVRKKAPELAVASPNRSLVVFPGNYLGRMLLPPYDDVTLMLMFNMIQAGKVPEAKADALEDISDGRLRHIVPRR